MKPSKVATNPRATLVSIPVAARELGLPYSTLREVVIRGDLPHVRLSGRGRYWLRRSDVETFIARATRRGVE